MGIADLGGRRTRVAYVRTASIALSELPSLLMFREQWTVLLDTLSFTLTVDFLQKSLRHNPVFARPDIFHPNFRPRCLIYKISS
jgi:hypothetical protein